MREPKNRDNSSFYFSNHHTTQTLMAPFSIYVFIDESGNHSRGKHYTVAATWCLSRQSRTTGVLSSTRDKVAHQAGVSGELKGASTPNSKLESILPSLTGYGYEDGSVEHNQVPWATEEPIRHTIHDTNPEIAKQTIGDLTGKRLEAPVIIQTLALASILNPLFYPERLNEEKFDEAKIVLDAETWENPSKNLKSAIDTVDSDSLDDINFEIKDSKSTPGLQISDLTAYSWLRHRKRGDCGEAVRSINKRRFADYK
jgi:hypothetical protein